MAERARSVHLAFLILLISLCFVLALATLRIHGALPPWLSRLSDVLTWCPYRQITGRPCPFCGLSTSFAWLVSGKLADAQRLHPLALALPMFLVSQMCYRFYRCCWPGVYWREELGLVIVVVIVVAIPAI